MCKADTLILDLMFQPVMMSLDILVYQINRNPIMFIHSIRYRVTKEVGYMWIAV